MTATSGSCHCGAARWTYSGEIKNGTVCSCTICRRYGVIWAYGVLGENVSLTTSADPLTRYVRGDKMLSFNFCKTCGCVLSWQDIVPDENGKTHIAVNLRMAEPEAVAKVPLRRFDGLHKWADEPRDGRTVGDIWF